MNQEVKPFFEIKEDDCAFKYKMKALYPGYTDAVQSYDELKFVHIMEGSGIWNINGHDYQVTKDDIVLLCRADERHMVKITSQTPLVTEQIEFLPMTLHPIQHCADFFFDRSKFFTNVLSGTDGSVSHLLTCFANLRVELISPMPYQREYIVHLLMGMVLTAARIFVGDRPLDHDRGKSCYNTVCRVMVYIKEHLQEDLSRDLLAKKHGISPSYLSRIFKEYSGVCLQNYIVQCRVQLAISLLKQGSVSVLDAALESGFTSTSGFYRAFHDVTKKKPRDLLKNNL